MISLAQLDSKLTKNLSSLIQKNNFLIKFLAFMTNSSDGKIYLFYMAIIPFIFPSSGIEIIKLGVAAFAFQVPAYLLIKNTIKRERPYISQNLDAYISPPDKYSFPSGHCASSTLLILVMNIFEPWLVPYLLIWMFIIYISRVALGLHFISDVFAGVALGITSLLIAKSILPLIF